MSESARRPSDGRTLSEASCQRGAGLIIHRPRHPDGESQAACASTHRASAESILALFNDFKRAKFGV